MITREGPGLLTIYLPGVTITFWPIYPGWFRECYPASTGETIRIWNTPLVRLARW